MTTITSINPLNAEEIASYDLLEKKEILDKIDEAQGCFLSFKYTSFGYRSHLMEQASTILEKNKMEYAETMTLEMGKTFQSAIAEVEKCAWVCRYYAENAEKFLEDELVVTEASKSLIAYRPLGVLLAVMPWNYPFWQVFRFAAPALMAGNVALLKHASNVPGCALIIEKVFKEAGFPKGSFYTLLINSDQVEVVLENKYVKAATLTGSGPAGEAVAAKAGSQIKKTVLELGGSDPYLILDDADLELAAEKCVQSRLLNAGQSCIGAKRFIVLAPVYEEFLSKFKEKMQNATIGDPMQSVDLGPMARHDLRDEVHDQVIKSVEKGAKILIGGYIPDQKGAFYPPTILTNVKPGMPAYSEEIFGPVASVIRVEDVNEAIKVANDTEFGLGAGVFTRDKKRGEEIAKNRLDAGCCFVNTFVKSDPRLPFGGINASGYGRELSRFGIQEFVNIKSIWVD